MDPLSQLRDIHAPEPIGLWPLAPGWWLATVVVLVIGIVLFRLIRNRSRRGLPRRNALRELDNCYSAFENNRDETKFIIEINMLLKKVAASYYGKSQVAKLSGDAWLAFLDNCAGADNFSRGAGSALASGPYRPNVSLDPAALRQACKQWISAHD